MFLYIMKNNVFHVLKGLCNVFLLEHGYKEVNQ